MVALEEARPAVDDSTSAPRVASFEDLLGRQPRTATVHIDLGEREVVMRFQAVSAHELDALEAANPADDDEQKRAGLALRWSRRTFVPALIAACSLEPKLTPEQVGQLVESAAWSVAEVNQLFDVCLDLCARSSVSVQGKD